METTFTPPPVHGVAKTQLSRYLLFGGIVLVAVVSVVLAVVLPNLSGDIRNQAWTSAACAGSVNVNLSVCNEGCGNDSHCATGLICYKTGTATEGVCRNAQVPTSTTCTVVTPPPVTPTPTPTSTPVSACMNCNYQFDAFWGPAIQSFRGGLRYARENRILATASDRSQTPLVYPGCSLTPTVAIPLTVPTLPAGCEDPVANGRLTATMDKSGLAIPKGYVSTVITNKTTNCTYTVGAAMYAADWAKNDFENQNLFDSKTATLAPGQSVELIVKSPTINTTTACYNVPTPRPSISPTPTPTPPVSGDVTLKVVSGSSQGSFAIKTLYPAGSNYMSTPSDNFTMVTQPWGNASSPDGYVTWGGVAWFKPATKVAFQAQQPPAGWCLIGTGVDASFGYTSSPVCRNAVISVVGGTHQQATFSYGKCTTSNWAATDCAFAVPAPGASGGAPLTRSVTISPTLSEPVVLGPSLSSDVYDIQLQNTSSTAVVFKVTANGVAQKDFAGKLSETVAAGNTVSYTYDLSNMTPGSLVLMQTTTGSVQVKSVSRYDITTGVKTTLPGYPKVVDAEGTSL